MNSWKKNIALYLASQIISLFGSMLVQCAMSWYITLETQSGTMMTIAIICGFLPTFLVSPFAGVWADRYDCKKIIVLADGLVAASTLGLVAAFMFGLRDFKLIFAVMAVRGLGQGIQQPAVNAFLPRLVPQDMLMRVNSVSSSAQSAMSLLSPALAGALMTFAPLEYIFLIDVATAALAITIMWIFVRAEKPERAQAAQKAGYFDDLKIGLRYIGGHKVVRALFAFSSALMILSAPAAMLCGLRVTQAFGPEAWRLSVSDVGFSAGMLVGSALLMTWGGFKNRHATICLGNYIFAVTTILFGVVPDFWLFIAVMVLCGTAMPFFSTPFVVLLQETVEPEYMGRVFSFSSMVMSLGMPLGLVVLGPLGDVIGLDMLFIGCGAVLLVMSVLFNANKTLRAAGEPRGVRETDTEAG
jgi:DHA3 family macrolide efflux protein-like MFS transporter